MDREKLEAGKKKMPSESALRVKASLAHVLNVLAKNLLARVKVQTPKAVHFTL